MKPYVVRGRCVNHIEIILRIFPYQKRDTLIDVFQVNDLHDHVFFVVTLYNNNR